MRRHTVSCWCETGEQGHRRFSAYRATSADEWARYRAYIEASMQADLLHEIQRHGGPWGWNVGVLEWKHEGDKGKDESQ
jgi:hypothetical protein